MTELFSLQRVFVPTPNTIMQISPGQFNSPSCIWNVTRRVSAPAAYTNETLSRVRMKSATRVSMTPRVVGFGVRLFNQNVTYVEGI